jgi:Amt family ammonium transporter
LSTELLLNLAWILSMCLLGAALPVGIGLLAARSFAEGGGQLAARILLAGLLALIVSLLCGFSLQYGAIHLPQLGEQPSLAWQWEPFGDGSGLLAWAGPGVPAAIPGRAALFLLQALGAITVVAIALAPLRRLPGPGWIGATVFISGLLYPLLGHWAWGNGWLAKTSQTALLGHGYVDYSGSGLYYALGGMLALAGLLVTSPRNIRPQHQDVEPGRGVLLGTLLALLGMTALHLATSWSVTPRLGLVVVNTWAAAAAGGLVAATYMAFTTTHLRPDMLSRGLLAGAAASAGIAAFAPPTTLLLVGAVAGLLGTLGSYVVERLWHLEDPMGIVPAFGLGGLWGVLAVGLFADGSFGQGLNGVGSGLYLGVPDQGVTGITLLASGMTPDYGQLAAQVLGIGVILVLGLGLGWLVFRSGTVSVKSAKQE